MHGRAQPGAFLFSVTSVGGGPKAGVGEEGLFPTALLMNLQTALGISPTLFLSTPGLASRKTSEYQSLRVSGQGTMGQIQLP